MWLTSGWLDCFDLDGVFKQEASWYFLGCGFRAQDLGLGFIQGVEFRVQVQGYGGVESR